MGLISSCLLCVDQTQEEKGLNRKGRSIVDRNRVLIADMLMLYIRYSTILIGGDL